MRKQKLRKCMSIALAVALTAAIIPVGTMAEKEEVKASTLSNPRIVSDSSMTAGQKVTWDCVWFGSYPQAEVIPSRDYTALDSSLLQDGDIIVSDDLYARLQSATGWDTNGDITIDGTKYRRILESDATYTSTSFYFYSWSDSTTYHYFKYESIKWRVLNVDGDEAFLLADKALDDQRYNTTWTSVTWETSAIRSWLNGYGASSNAEGTDYTGKNFIDTAFSADEQSAIQMSTVINDDNLSYGTEGGNNTNDKVFLLSESEIYTDSAASYGFVSNKSTYDEARRSTSSTYAKAMGTYSSTSTAYAGNCYWWLRSPGLDSYYATYVYGSGGVCYNGILVNDDDDGCRPALRLNLSSSNLYSYAGTVCSDEVGGGNILIKPEISTTNETSKSQNSTAADTVNNTTKETSSNAITNETENTKTTSIKKLKKAKKSLKVTWKKVKGVTGYQIQYSTTKKFKKAKTATVKKAKTTSKTIKKLKAKTKYYVRIRTYITVSGKKYYSAWSKAKSKKTK